jgi:hypothetical protein
VTRPSTTVTLAAPGGEATHATGHLTILTPGQRGLRAALTLLGAVALAALIIPVPIVHLVGIPIILVAGIVAAVRQYRGLARLEPMRIACPKCGASNAIGGGLGYPTATGPIHRPCEHCRRELELRFATT